MRVDSPPGLSSIVSLSKWLVGGTPKFTAVPWNSLRALIDELWEM
jgi:hypothetical protein